MQETKVPPLVYLETLDDETKKLSTDAVMGRQTSDAGIVYRMISHSGGGVQHMQLFNRMYGVQLTWPHKDRTLDLDVLSLFAVLSRDPSATETFASVLPFEQIAFMNKCGGTNRRRTQDYPLVADKRTMSLFVEGSEDVWSFARLGYAEDTGADGTYCGGIVYIEYRPSRLNERTIGKRNPKSRFEVLNITDPTELELRFKTLRYSTMQLQGMSAEYMAQEAARARADREKEEATVEEGDVAMAL